MEQMALDYSIAGGLEGLLPRLELAASPAGITRVSMRHGPRSHTFPTQGARIGELLQQATEELAGYLTGARTFFTVPVDLSRLPAFDREALQIAARIPYGQVKSYKWIAEQMGAPLAARAVGKAMAGNPIPLIVPCHRVVRTDGGLGGYSFGLVRKEALLGLERRTAPFVGCPSTGIVCRRGCPEERRLPEGGHIHFASLADTTTSGYRPCPVCRPA
jgi:O-6-methylguanine DNA methyltransferase